MNAPGQRGPRRPRPAALGATAAPCDSLPANYPPTHTNLSNNPDPGYFFVTPTPSPTRSGGMVIIDERAQPIFYRQLPKGALDFKLQQGVLTYHDNDKRKYYAMDSSYTVVDSFQAGNGYLTDFHGLQMLDDGHTIIYALEAVTVPMDSLVPGGCHAAVVTGNVLQELDIDRNVIFEWRSFDHISILDADPRVTTDFTACAFTYMNANSVEVDHDGNFLFSIRQINQVIKIDRLTGDVIWRFGRHGTHNDFTFLNDPRGFYLQHDARRLPNGELSVFDNGNYHETVYSRALRYQLDEVNMVATLVWEYRNTPDVYTRFMGSARKLPSGGTLIGWGGTDQDSTDTIPKVTELHPDDSKALELSFGTNIYSYRAFKFPWRTTLIETDAHALDFGVVFIGDSASLPVSVTNHSSADLTIDCALSTDPDIMVTSALPITLGSGATTVLDVAFQPTSPNPVDAKLYLRAVNDTQLVAQDVSIRGLRGTVDVGSTDLAFRLHPNAPNPFNPSTAIRFDLPRKSPVTIEVFDVHGRRVETLVNEVRPAGRHELTWIPRHRDSGVYFYRMTAGNYRATRKLVLME